MKRSVALALPLPSAVPGAQTLQQVALGVGLAPGVSDAVGGQSVLVVAAIWGRGGLIRGRWKLVRRHCGPFGWETCGNQSECLTVCGDPGERGSSWPPAVSVSVPRDRLFGTRRVRSRR